MANLKVGDYCDSIKNPYCFYQIINKAKNSEKEMCFVLQVKGTYFTPKSTEYLDKETLHYVPIRLRILKPVKPIVIYLYEQ